MRWINDGLFNKQSSPASFIWSNGTQMGNADGFLLYFCHVYVNKIFSFYLIPTSRKRPLSTASTFWRCNGSNEYVINYQPNNTELAKGILCTKFMYTRFMQWCYSKSLFLYTKYICDLRQKTKCFNNLVFQDALFCQIIWQI